ncbi:MAG: hypothetical protein JWN22_3941 [Nocardioides sp.]|nr:hypothetical protein [Nocardioides sp.]
MSRLAFPGSPADPLSSVGDLYEVAVARAKRSVQDLFERELRVDPASTPKRFDKWFALPWKRHYTLNVDDLDEVVNSRTHLARPITSISAQGRAVIQTSNLLSVHLNGRLRDFPDITFSARQYARRAGAPDPWYDLLTSDLLSSPVLFIGTVLDEPGLWLHIELRATRHQGDVELRPPSYLVSPSLPQARAALLKRFNVDWIEATESEFFGEVLSSASAEAEQGTIAIQRMHHPAAASRTLRSLDHEVTLGQDGDLKLYLKGRDPRWADVNEDGYAVVREFEKELGVKAASGKHGLILLTGTAATGKTTTGMRLALGMHAQGRRAYTFDTVTGTTSADAVLRQARNLRPQVLFIDDADVFGERAGGLLRDLVKLPDTQLVIATIRNSKLQSLALEDDLFDTDYVEMNIPTLEDSDISKLIATLERAGSLGMMTGLSNPDRIKLFREQAGRQLLVAMYYATSGERLEDKVRSECEDLGGASRLAYGMAAWATSEHQYVTKQELLLGVSSMGFGGSGNSVLNELERLVNRQLLIYADGGLRIRHRWIAEESLKFYSSNGLMRQVIQSFAFALASGADPQLDRNSRERKLLRRIINHDRLKRVIGDVSQCREIYSALQDRLAWDFHFWLQRGSLEVESGDLTDAKNYLESARSLTEGKDFRVENEYAYLMLKRASEHPSSESSIREATAALQDLEEAMRARGEKESYPFHVYGSQGLRWARRAVIPAAEKRILIGRLLEAVKRGREWHPTRDDLRQLERDLEREYLMQAAD